jgi:hypothetical protein
MAERRLGILTAVRGTTRKALVQNQLFEAALGITKCECRT